MIKSEACSRNTSSGLEKLNYLTIVTECRLGSPSGKSRAGKVLVLGGCIWSRCMGKHRQRGKKCQLPPQCPTVLGVRGCHRAV